YQLAEMERTGTIPEEIEIRSPASGFVVLRNVTADLRFDKGAELYRIADISRVWVLADVFENEASFFQPGQRVKLELPYQKKTMYATMSNVLPQFDPATRTLKMRLEVNNPGYALRPDMFVNVELVMNGPQAIIVPVDAVLDSGLKKTVFIDRGNGIFEPRQVETGRSLGERVEIVQGLMPGEKIVVSGNFLLDSESRMQQAASGTVVKTFRDPVCGMNTDEDRARAAGHFHEYQGGKYYFCSTECRDEFIKSPKRYTGTAMHQGSMPPAPAGAAKEKKPKPGAAINHQDHDHGAMQGSEHSSPTPMRSNVKMMKPAANGKANMPMDAAAMPGAKTNPAPFSDRSLPVMTESPEGKPPLSPKAASPMPVTSGGQGRGTMPGAPGAAPPPEGNPMQPRLPGQLPAAIKTDKSFLPAMNSSPVFPAPGAVQNALPPGAPGANVAPEAAGGAGDQKKRYPANMRTKNPAGRMQMPGQREASSPPDENAAITPRKTSPLRDEEMKRPDGE
ncbi:MAG: hypothetical protein CVU72_02685, partial [Deltaproteobacteria bacterium HGW-Deltaproteobacteria-7]